MTRKITYQELKDRLQNPNLSESEMVELSTYFIVDESKAFNPATQINWELVERPVLKNSATGELAIGGGNVWDWFYRHEIFNRRCRFESERPILVSEGDSWFQFPVMLHDVIDHLIYDRPDFRGYNICSLDAAGDTLKNMIFSRPQIIEKLRDLRESQLTVSGLLFSGGGNDLLGNDENGKPVLHSILNHDLPQPSLDNVFREDRLKLLFQQIRLAYEKLFLDVHSEFPELPIFIHSYDYVYPGKFIEGDRREPHWIGKAMADIGITDKPLQREITTRLLNQLHAIQQSLAAEYAQVHLIETLGTLDKVEQWSDEIHPTSAGFRLVADKFAAKIKQVIQP